MGEGSVELGMMQTWKQKGYRFKYRQLRWSVNKMVWVRKRELASHHICSLTVIKAFLAGLIAEESLL